MAAGTVRTSISIPKELKDELDRVSSGLGITKSAIVSQLLGEGLSVISELLSAMPGSDTPSGLRRFRGKSEEVIEEKLRQFRRGQDDLFRGK